MTRGSSWIRRTSLWKAKLHPDRLGDALDRRGRARVRCRRQRDVPLAREERRRRVQADPAGSGDEDLGPGVQVGEVGRRAGRPVEADHAVGVRCELHEVARHEARREAVLPQQADQQPRTVAARTDPEAQGVVGGLDARLHPHRVGDVAVDRGVQGREEVDGDRAALGLRRQLVLPGRRVLAVVDRSQVRRQVGRQRRLVGEREPLGVLLDEEVERVDHHQVGNQADGDVEDLDLLREDDPGQPVAERVLLPVEEVVLRADVE